MQTLARVEEARRYAQDVHRDGLSLGLVPTMGYLHEGHLALVRTLRQRVDRVAMSIFVNPTQFGPGEDVDTYPRDLARDLRLAREAGVDCIFHPPAEEIYPLDPLTAVEVAELGRRLEGRSRPTHFRGVTTVVCKLLNVFAPELAAFGQKDAQQAVIVRRMVRELLLGCEIVVVPTVRESDGLARSSRNVYLTDPERRAAPVLHQALDAAQAAIVGGLRDAHEARRLLAQTIAAEPLARLDYAAVADAQTLEELEQLHGRVLLLVAARFGRARLIDNACLEIDGAGVRAALP